MDNDNVLVRLCAEIFVRAHQQTPITGLRFMSVCVCNQWAYADDYADAVNQLLIDIRSENLF